jgi:hypothetical protein
MFCFVRSSLLLFFLIWSILLLLLFYYLIKIKPTYFIQVRDLFFKKSLFNGLRSELHRLSSFTKIFCFVRLLLFFFLIWSILLLFFYYLIKIKPTYFIQLSHRFFF